MVKCLTIFSCFPKHATDSGDWKVDFIESIKKMGVEVFVLTPHAVGTLSHEMRNGINISRFKYFYPTKFQKLAYGGGMPYNIKRSTLAKLEVPLFVLSELYHAIRISRIEQVDIINSHWLVPQGFVGAICKVILRKPHIATLHSSEITLLRKIPFGKIISQFIAMNSDQIISVSKHRADEFVSFLAPKYQEICKQKIKIIPMGVNCGAPHILTDVNYLREQYNVDSKHVILFVGRLVEVKGCEYLIESIRTVIVHRNDVLLLILGGGPLESTLKRIVFESGLTQYVRFEGFVGHDKIWDYYALADIVVIPSIVDSSGYEEGLPVNLLEAIIAGKAVIGTNIKGISEVIHDGENGLLVDQKNSKQLADKIVDLLKNDELRTTLSQNALTCAKKYNRDFIAGKYVDIMLEFTSLKKEEKGEIE